MRDGREVSISWQGPLSSANWMTWFIRSLPKEWPRQLLSTTRSSAHALSDLEGEGYHTGCLAVDSEDEEMAVLA